MCVGEGGRAEAASGVRACVCVGRVWHVERLVLIAGASAEGRYYRPV